MVTIVDTQPHASVVKEKICRHCGVTLSYVPNDVSTRQDRDYTGGVDTVRYITCPCCKQAVTI